MKRLVIALLFVLMALSGCEKNEILSADKRISRVELNVAGLNNLGDSAWYELWIAGLKRTTSGDEQTLTSIGVFTVDDNGQLSQTSFDVDLGYLQEAITLMLTVEEDNVPGTRFVTTQPNDSTTVTDTLYTPSVYQIAAAQIQANQGTLTISHADIIDFDFSSAAGTYVLATPTGENISTTGGIWFVNDTSAAGDSKMAGLNLPKLSSKWLYEGWVVVDGSTLSTGTFLNPAAVDKQAVYSGDSLGNGYNFPGEDFLSNAPAGLSFPLDLSGSEVYISLSAPHPANVISPFTLRVLSAAIPANASVNTVYEMQNTISDEPLLSSSIEISIKLYE